MAKTKEQNEDEIYQCKECSLWYKDKEVAEKCQAWCKEHKSCNLEIIKHSIKNMDTQDNNQKEYVCESCGSKTKGEAGTCCGAPRKPAAMKCGTCGHEHKSDGTCDCGCK